MNTTGPFLSRRTLLGVGAATALAATTAVVIGSRDQKDQRTQKDQKSKNSDQVRNITLQLRALEREHSARLGVFARNTNTGAVVLYRADERFPICSVFKTLPAAAVLRDLDQNGEFLAKHIRYTEKDVTSSGYAPITGQAENLAKGMSVEALCAAAISYSDNTAANLLLAEQGGPTSVTRFCRSIGDKVTRLDRWEPELNSAEPERVTDITTPRAIGQTYARITLGKALAPVDREKLTGWLLANTTSTQRFRAGLPKDWAVADKTGTGAYGTTNNVGVAWTSDDTPIVLAVLSSKDDQDAAQDEALIADTARILANTLAPSK